MINNNHYKGHTGQRAFTTRTWTEFFQAKQGILNKNENQEWQHYRHLSFEHSNNGTLTTKLM